MDVPYEIDERYAPKYTKYGSRNTANPYFYHSENEINRYFGTRMLCRNGHLKHKHKYEIISPIPLNTYTSMSYDLVVEDAVNYMVEKANGRKINLMWSGGIDSTVPLYGFARAGIKINVHYDESTKIENITAYNDLESGKYGNLNAINHGITNEKYALRTHIIPYKNDEENCFVTGEVGDQIFGTGRVFLFTKEQRNAHYRENAPEWICSALEKSVNSVLNKPDVNLKQWHWAWSFNAKYQWVMIRCKQQYDLTPYGPNCNTYAFYDTPNYQRWSITNQDENSAWQEIPEYKWASKQWIYEQNGDKFYRDNKLKTPSANRIRTAEGFNFDCPVTGLEVSKEYMMVIKKTFGKTAPPLDYADDETLKNMQ